VSAGTAIGFGLNASGISFQRTSAALFAMTTLSWPILLYIANQCTDTNYGTEENVIVPIHVRHELGLDDKKEIEETVPHEKPVSKVE
jgi:hypothetical protein